MWDLFATTGVLASASFRIPSANPMTNAAYDMARECSTFAWPLRPRGMSFIPQPNARIGCRTCAACADNDMLLRLCIPLSCIVVACAWSGRWNTRYSSHVHVIVSHGYSCRVHCESTRLTPCSTVAVLAQGSRCMVQARITISVVYQPCHRTSHSHRRVACHWYRSLQLLSLHGKTLASLVCSCSTIPWT